MAKRVALLVGTRKGLFVLDGDADRDEWTTRGPLCEGWPIHDAIMDPKSGAILAGGGSNWYGPAVWRSDDLGETWTHSSEGMTYGDDGEKIATIWNLSAGPDALYAGVEPAGLFRSRDDGATWQHVEGLTNHPSRPEWLARQRRPDPPFDRPEPHRQGSGLGRDLVGRRVRDPGRRRDLGDAQQGRARRLPAGHLPRVRPVRAQAGHGR